MSRPGNTDIHPLLREIRTEKTLGKIHKRFEDDYYALDLIKDLYDDSIANSTKVELLINLEEFGFLGISEDSVDQIVTSLLDIYHQIVDKGDNWTVACQILLTCTSLIVQLEQLQSDLCKSFVKELVSIVTSRVNQPDSHRLRSCACQCLIHLEEFEPGLLVNHYDDFCELARQERTDVFQDYALLVAKVLGSTGCFSGEDHTAGQHGDQKTVQKQTSFESQDVRQMAAFLVENIPLYTRSGTFRMVESLSSLAKSQPEVSPMIFKPPMLHQMSTMSCVIFHTVLFLQRKFKGEILSQQEEMDLIHRLCNMTDHPSLNQFHRQLASQWAQMYQRDGEKRVAVHDSIRHYHRLIFYPSVFDSIDVQLRKLYMTAVCGDTSNDIAGVETSILLGSLGCLHKIVWHTGSGRAARALFRALYFIYTYHNNKSFSKDIQRFVRGLISEFAHFIPHSIDFADSINDLGVDSQVYIDTLTLLHQQVVMATEEQICSSYQFYLQIMKKAGAHKEIDQKPTLKFLADLAENADIIDDSSWKLGHGILDICRNIIMCHGTPMCFMEDEILQKTDEQNKSYATLSFIISAAFVLPALTLLGKALHKINNQKIDAFEHHLSYFTWLLVACLLTCILNILNLFDNFLNNDQQMKSGKTCYYIYVIDGTFMTFVGVCLLCLAIDIMYTVLSKSEHLTDISRRKMRIHFLNFLWVIVCFIGNNMPHIVDGVSFRNLYKCWKGNAYKGHIHLAAKIDLGLQGFVILATWGVMVISAVIMKYRARSSDLFPVPDYMKVTTNCIEENVEQIEQVGSDAKVSTETPNSDISAKTDRPGNLVEEEIKLKRKRSSRRRFRIGSSDIGSESTSKESSGHENSGYISEGNEQDIRRQSSVRVTSTYLGPPRFYSSRRRFKSDSEIPRNDAYIGVNKSRKQSSRKVLEEQVYEALESFFVTDPSKLLFRALGSQKQCELSMHLIDDNGDEKGMEEETCFNGSGTKSSELKRKKRTSPLRKVKSLKGMSSYKYLREGNQWSSPNDKEKFRPGRSSSEICVSVSAKGISETVHLKTTVGQSVTESKSELKDDAINSEGLSKGPGINDGQSPEDFYGPVVNFNGPDIVIEDVFKDNSTSDANMNHSSERNEDTFLSVKVDVHHCSDLSESVSSVDTVGTVDEDRAKSRHSDCSVKDACNPECWVKFTSESVSSAKPCGRVKWEDEMNEKDLCLLEEKAEEKKNETSKSVGPDSVVSMEDSNKEEAVSKEVEKENDVEVGKDERRESDADFTLEIETENVVEKKKEEMLTFKEYYKQYLLRPYKNVANLLLVYCVCLLPQMVLDVYRILIGSPISTDNPVDGILSICSDAAMSIFLLAVTVVFLWQFRKRRNEKFGIRL